MFRAGYNRRSYSRYYPLLYARGRLIDSSDKHVTEWTLLNAAGQRIMVQNGTVSEIKMSNHPTSVYILLMLMDDGTTEFHKFFKR